MIIKFSFQKIAIFLLFITLTVLDADISSNEKVLILTDYLIKQENQTPTQARNEAVATVFGKPIFTQLSYDDDTEMFFGRVSSTKTPLSRKINFYMPKRRAHDFMKNKDDAKLEIIHKVKDNEVKISSIDLNYRGIRYPMALKSDTSMNLKIGAYFVAAQDTTISAETKGIGGSIDLQEVFNLQEKTQALRIDFGYEFNQKHKISASYYKIDNSNTRTIAPIEFDGVSIGGDVNLQFNITITKLTYIYSAYRTNKFEFTTRVGLHLTTFDTRLSTVANVNGSTTSSEQINLNLPAPLPVFGLGFDYDISDDLALSYHVDYFNLTTEIQGSMVDTQIELNYMLYDYLGFSLGINTTKMDFSTQVNQTTVALNHDIAGVMASVIFRY